MPASHCGELRDVLVWTSLLCILCSPFVYARPIPKEQFATLGDFPDFAALSANVTSEYFSNEVLEQFLHGLGEHYPDYVTVFKIGDSVNGAPILALDIGSTAGDLDEKPYFLWVGNMHGNEPSGRPLLLALALHLASSKSALVQKVRNRMHTIIVPTLNPDGFKTKFRENAHKKDLNRAFPDRSDPGVQPSLPMTGTEEPEVQAIMKLAYSLPITGAASLHEGALVANYPWDGDKEHKKGYAAAPDDATFQHLARSYAQKHSRMADQTPFPGDNTPAREFFKGGITNGNDWYAVFNGMQDWLYIARGCRALTLELWNSKWPAVEHLPAMWEENSEAMLTLSAAAALGGVHGTLRGPGAAKATITAGGLPVHAYAIPHSPEEAQRQVLDAQDASADEISDGDADGASETHDVHSFAANADAVFHLPLAPGKHTITVTAPGASPVEKPVEVPDNGGGVGVHVELAQGDTADAVTGADGRDAPGGLVETGFPYVAIAGRGAGGSSGSGGAIMQVHPAGRLDIDSSDSSAHDERSTARPDSGTDVATGGAALDLGGSTGDAGSSTPGSGTVANTTAAPEKLRTEVDATSQKADGSVAGGAVQVEEVAEEPPHSTAFFILRGAMAGAGAVFIVVQLMRLRGRTAPVATAPARRGHHHQSLSVR